MYRACLIACLAARAAIAEPVGFERSQFGQVALSRLQSGDAQLEIATGGYRNESIRNYAPDSLLAEMGRAVGRLDVLTDAGMSTCTAFVVSDRHLLTNHHCVPGLPERNGATRVEAVSFLAGYIEEGVAEGTRAYRVSPVPVEADRRLDYAVLEVFGDPAAQFGALALSTRRPGDGDPFWVIGHPLGEAQRISREGCRANAPPIAEGRLLHGCDTLPGNSGSPVIDASGRGVVGLHHAGSRRNSVNFAIPMARILERSEVLSTAAPPSPLAAEAEMGARLCDALYEEAETRTGCFAYEAFVARCPDHPLAGVAAAFVEDGRCGAAATAAAPSPAPAPAPFDILAATDLPGGDIGREGIRGISLSDCEAYCRAEPICQAFTYVSGKSWCWPKRAALARQAAPGMTSGIRRGAAAGARDLRPRAFLRVPGTDFLGGDLTGSGYRGVTLDRCEAICRDDPSCAAYSYVTAMGWCWPKRSVAARVPAAGIVSGVAR